MMNSANVQEIALVITICTERMTCWVPLFRCTQRNNAKLSATFTLHGYFEYDETVAPISSANSYLASCTKKIGSP